MPTSNVSSAAKGPVAALAILSPKERQDLTQANAAPTPRARPALASGKSEDAAVDDNLVMRIGTGDAAAWQPLVDRHLTRLIGFAWHILGDKSEAEDVAQEAFIRLMRKAPDWQPGGAKVRSWLYRVAVNLCIDRKRKVRPAQLDENLPIPDPNSSGRELDRRIDIETAVRRALDDLPDRQRMALVLVHYHGFSNPETAAMMESSVEAVESMLARGRRALRASLKSAAGELLGA